MSQRMKALELPIIDGVTPARAAFLRALSRASQSSMTFTRESGFSRSNGLGIFRALLSVQSLAYLMVDVKD